MTRGRDPGGRILHPPDPAGLRRVENLRTEADLEWVARWPTPPLIRPAPRLLDPEDWQHLDCWSWVPRTGSDTYDRSREAYAVRLPQGAFVAGCSRCHWEGSVYDHERLFWLNEALTPAVPPRARGPARPVGKLVTVIQRLASDYYHFLQDTLPKLLLVQDLLREPSGYRLLLHAKPWTRQFLELLGIPEDRCLGYRPKDEPLFYSEDLVLVNYWPDWDGGCPTLLGPLRSHFVPRPVSPEERRLVIYVDRDDANPLTFNKARRVVNQEELLRELRRLVPPEELVIFRGSRHTIAETIDLFRRARLLVGPHGGAFANLVFSPEGARVVELVPTDVHYAPTWHASAALGLEYWAVPVPGSTWASDFTVDVPRLTRLLRQLV